MSNFQFPMQKGVEFDIPGLHTPATVRFIGVDPQSPYGKQVMQFYEGVIRQFQASNAQNYALSGAPQMQRRVVVNPELTLTYNNQWGRELITASVTPMMPVIRDDEVVKEVQKTFPDLTDIIYDGYLFIFNVNAAKDDIFEIFLNDKYVGKADFSEDEPQAFMWYFYQYTPEFAKRLDDLRVEPPVPQDDIFVYPYDIVPDYQNNITENFIQVIPNDDSCVINYTGNNVLEMRNIATNDNGNYGVVRTAFFSQLEADRTKVRKGPRISSSDGSLSCLTNIKPIYYAAEYSGDTGESFKFDFSLDS